MAEVIEMHMYKGSISAGSLCGSEGFVSNNVVAVTCQECRELCGKFANPEPVTKVPTKSIFESIATMSTLSHKENRSTSSTGGQKGVKLERHDLIPVGPLRELAVHFGRGARKYDNHQWRAGYEWSKSYSAMMRHQTEFWAGRDYDVCSNDLDGCSHVDNDGNPYESPEPDTCYNHTGSHHMVAVAWHSFVLLEFRDCHPDFDDRYIVQRETT